GEQLDGLGLGGAGEQDGHVLVLGSFQEQVGDQAPGAAGVAHDDARGVQVVVQGAALAQELGGEQDARAGVLGAQPFGEADGDGGLDDDDRLGGVGQDVGGDGLDGGGVEEVGLGVVVGGGGDDHDLGAV